MYKIDGCSDYNQKLPAADARAGLEAKNATPCPLACQVDSAGGGSHWTKLANVAACCTNWVRARLTVQTLEKKLCHNPAYIKCLC